MRGNTKKELFKELWGKDKAYYYGDSDMEAKIECCFNFPLLMKIKDYCIDADTILEIGCGQGAKLAAVSGDNSIAIGVDLSKIALEYGKKKLQTLNFILGDFEELPISSNSMDAAVSVWVLEHSTSPEHLIQEMIRVTKVGGFVMFIAPNYGSPFMGAPNNKISVANILRKLLKSHLLLIFPKRRLYWDTVTPKIPPKGKQVPDWDTVVEPYIFTLIKYLEKMGIRIVEYDSSWEWRIGKDKSEDMQHKTHPIVRAVKYLKKRGISPYRYFGATLFVAGKKENRE